MKSKKLDIYLKREFIGNLIQNKDGALEFKYDQKYLSNENAVAISHSLPLQEEVFTERQCKGFFSGILPEESNRDIIANILGVSARNNYALLEQIGGECAGAISFLENGSNFPSENFKYRKMSDSQVRDILLKLPARPLLVGEPEVRLSLAGAQNKIVVNIDGDNNIYLPLGGAPSKFILKPEVSRFPNIVSNEALCLILAKKVGIPSANVMRTRFGDVECLLIERYDRISSNKSYPTRLHQEDFCQAMNFLPIHKYQNEGGPGLKESLNLIKEVSIMPALDVQNFLKMVIFNMIIGNNDAHGKNFSLLYDSQGNVRLAPAYDMLSTIYYEEPSKKMAMKIGKEYESSKLNIKEIERFAVDCDFTAIAICRLITDIANKIIVNLADLRSDFEAIDDLINLIEKRSNFFKVLSSNRA